MNFWKWLLLAFVALVLINWLTAGHDNIIEGPPECLDVTQSYPC